MTDKENILLLQDSKDSEIMECISGMIRYGYQEAIDEIRKEIPLLVEQFGNFDYIESCQSHTTDFFNQKLDSMQQNKKQINLQKLQNEINEQ